MDITLQRLRLHGGSIRPNFDYSAGVIVNPIFQWLSALTAGAIPVDRRITGLVNQTTPAVKYLDIDALDKAEWKERSEKIICAVAIGCKCVWQNIAWAIVYTDDIAKAAFIAN